MKPRHLALLAFLSVAGVAPKTPAAQPGKIELTDERLEDLQNGPEVEVALPESEHDFRRWKSRMAVKRTQISLWFSVVTEKREEESPSDYLDRIKQDQETYSAFMLVDRVSPGEVAAVKALLEKAVRWGKTAKETNAMDFEKDLGSLGYSDWRFVWERGKGRIAGGERLELWQAEAALKLLAKLPEASKALADKTKALAEQDALFR